ncbi:betaglucosidase [Colletotrichum higginsianum]|nr:betaglucosidase [Colletotrichum higginsianum]
MTKVPDLKMTTDTTPPLDVEALIKQLSWDEKIELLAGQGSFRTTGLPHRGIPDLVSRPQTGLMEFVAVDHLLG